MKSYDPQLMDALFRLLTCKPVEFVFLVAQFVDWCDIWGYFVNAV